MCPKLQYACLTSRIEKDLSSLEFLITMNNLGHSALTDVAGFPYSYSHSSSNPLVCWCVATHGRNKKQTAGDDGCMDHHKMARGHISAIIEHRSFNGSFVD